MNQKYIRMLMNNILQISLVLLVIIIIVSIIFYKYQNYISILSENDIPLVDFPFKNMFDDENKLLNIILISAPFREKIHEDNYELYKSMGLSFCGISSYINFPGHIKNPYEDRYHEEKNHDYPSMVDAWLHCFRSPPVNLQTSQLPLLRLCESDLKDFEKFKPDPSIKKEYDFMYVCLQDNETCQNGWQSYNRNWYLAKKCLEIMCGEFKLKGILVGRTNCEFTNKCDGIVKTIPQLDFDKFQIELQKCKFLFVPNISDASPRILTEAICYNIPVLVNYNIMGGWHYVVSGVTGEFFINDRDVGSALRSLTTNLHGYYPRNYFIKNHGKKKDGKRLAQFLISHYPSINNKNMKYATIAI